MGADCRYIKNALVLQILDQPAVLLLEDEPAWVAWCSRVALLQLSPGGAAFTGSRVETIRTELMLQNRVRKDAGLGSDTISALEAACSGPLNSWVRNLSELNIKTANHHDG